MTETMTPEMVPAGDGSIERLLAAADAMATELAIGGLMAGPAGEQAGLADLLVDDAPVGAWGVAADDTFLVVLLGPGGTARWPDPTQLGPVLGAAAAALGSSIDALEVLDDIANLPAGVDAEGLTWAGAGVFDGDQPVAAVGVMSGWTPPAPPAEATDDADEQSAPVGQAPVGQAPTAAPVADTGAASAAAATTGGGVQTVEAPRNLHLLAEVALDVTAELGRTTMTMGELLDLKPGGVIELDREAGAPIDIAVNHTLIARGEVVMVGGRYAVRITEVVADGGIR